MADPIQRLTQRLARLPGIGDKTAMRLALHIVRAPPAHVRELAEALIDAIDKVRLCSVCMNLTEDDPCARCRSGARDEETICVVASPADLMAIERAGGYRGSFHVLHGQLSPLEGIGPEDLKIDELLARVSPAASDAPRPREIILALSANVEGEATSLYLARLIKPLGLTVSRIASGLPVGGELEYADRATIVRALQSRLEV